MTSSDHYEYSENEEYLPLLDSGSSVRVCESENNPYPDEASLCIFCTESKENQLYEDQDLKVDNGGIELLGAEIEQKCIKQCDKPEFSNTELNIGDNQNWKLIGISEGTPYTEIKDLPLTDKNPKLHKVRDITSLTKHCAFQHTIHNKPSGIEGNDKLIQGYFFKVQISRIIHRE